MPLPDSTNSHDEDDVIRIKREPLYVWLARLTWLIVLIVLLEYALKSHQEREPQAAITAGAICLLLLLAGIVVEIVRYVEAQPESRLLRDVARANSAGNTRDTAGDTAASEHAIDDIGDKDSLYE